MSERERERERERDRVDLVRQTDRQSLSNFFYKKDIKENIFKKIIFFFAS